MARINLRTQVQDVLPRVFGGTDNEFGAASRWLLIHRVNDSGASLALGTLVNVNNGVYKSTTAFDTQIGGVIVGRISGGRLEEVAVGASEDAAIAVAGVVMVLTTSTASRGQFVGISSTAGQAAVTTGQTAGSFGHVVQTIGSTKCQALIGHLAATGGVVSFVTPAIVLGSAAAAGAATTFIRSDATIAAFDATSPTTQAIGDSAVVGTAAFAARRDHKHAMPAFGTGPAAVGTQANGSSANIARIDHVHATGAGTPSTQAFGDAASTGSGPAASMTDHKHAMPGRPEVVMSSGITPPDPVLTSDGLDWVYSS